MLYSTNQSMFTTPMHLCEASSQYGFPSYVMNLSPDNNNNKLASNYTLRAVLYINDTPRDMLSYNYNLTRTRVSTIPTSSARTALVLNYTNSLPPRSNSTEYMNAPHTLPYLGWPHNVNLLDFLFSRNLPQARRNLAWQCAELAADRGRSQSRPRTARLTG